MSLPVRRRLPGCNAEHWSGQERAAERKSTCRQLCVAFAGAPAMLLLRIVADRQPVARHQAGVDGAARWHCGSESREFDNSWRRRLRWRRRCVSGVGPQPKCSCCPLVHLPTFHHVVTKRCITGAEQWEGSGPGIGSACKSLRTRWAVPPLWLNTHPLVAPPAHRTVRTCGPGGLCKSTARLRRQSHPCLEALPRKAAQRSAA